MSCYSIIVGQETVQIGSAADLAVALDVLQGQYDLIVPAMEYYRKTIWRE
jgi:hypothetical protein